MIENSPDARENGHTIEEGANGHIKHLSGFPERELIAANLDHPVLAGTWPNIHDNSGQTHFPRFEATCMDLLVRGNVPKELDGTFYRMSMDPLMPPTKEWGHGYVPLDGDGMVTAFRIQDGHVDLKQVFVQTDKYKLERKARKALFGLYRNPFTHHPCVRNAIDSTANTNIVYHNGQLLALKESANPYVMDPNTLETLGYNPYGHLVNTLTFSAHPKKDPRTGDLVCWGYEAKGLATTDVVVFTIGPDGKKKSELWFNQPYASFLHDGAITENYVILATWPFEANVERMKKHGHHWAFDYEKPVMFFVIPRDASSPEAVRTYIWDNCIPIHTANAYEEDGKIVAYGNLFPFFPADKPDEKQKGVGIPDLKNIKLQMHRFCIDPSKPSGSRLPDPEVTGTSPGDFPRIDDRYTGVKNTITFETVYVPNTPHVQGMGTTGIARFNHTTHQTDFFYAGPDTIVQECNFVPRSPDAAEADGFIVVMVDRIATHRNDLLIIDTKNFQAPCAIVELPFHTRAGVHGNWVDAEQIPDGRTSIVDIPKFSTAHGGMWDFKRDTNQVIY